MKSKTLALWGVLLAVPALTPLSISRADTIVSGESASGALTVGQTNSYTFQANSGDSLLLRAGATGFNPRVQLYGPGGTLVGLAGSAAFGAVDAFLTATATNTGTFTVAVSSVNTGQSGTYALHLAQIPGTFIVSPGDQGGALTNGTANHGTNTLGDLDMWSFTANAGDSVLLRMGGVGINPRIDLYGPSGQLLGTAGSGAFGAVDALLSLTVTNSGTFTAVTSAFNLNQSGTYTLHLAQIPGNFVVSPGEQGGALTNGTANPGTNTLGDLQMWSFSANAGDSILLRMGGVGINPRIDLYGPAGQLLGTAGSGAFGAVDALLSLTVTNSGTFTAVTSAFTLNQSGTYTLHLAQIPGVFVVSPGEQGGALVNGSANHGTNTLGDLQMWSFTANAGDSILLRMGASGLNPRIQLYGPSGVLVGSAGSGAFGAVDALLAATATNSGTFTVVSSAFSLNQSGTYTLHLAQIPGTYVVSPGEQGGALVNGTANDGTNTLGDLQMWSFPANAGDTILLRMGASGFNPRIDIYGPTGELVGAAGSGAFGAVDASLSITATNSGTFTVVASAFNLNQSGTYTLHLAQIPGSFVISPGEQGGVLTNGITNLGTNTLGNLDMWSFTAGAGDSILLRMGASGFNPRMDLYDPSGVLQSTAGSAAFGAVDALLSVSATNSGTFTVIASAYNLNQSGTYDLTLAHAPGEAFVSPGHQGGAMVNGFTYAGTNALGNMEVWGFYGTVGDSNAFRIATTNFTPALRLYDPAGTLVAQAFVNNNGNRTNFMPCVVTNEGNYTLVATAGFLQQSGTYSLKQSRVPPDLLLPGTQTITDEGQTLTVPVSAQDPDDPNKSLTFLLVSGPPNAALTTLGPTNASLSWTTTDADGPSTNVVRVSVTDVVNGQSFIRTNNLTIIVREVNKPPVLSPVAAQTVNELTLLTVSNAATEPDLHSATIGYGLLNAPNGASIDASGIFTWTPTQIESPSTNVITTVVTNNNPYDAINPQLTATNTFQVIVKEVNMPPVLPIVPPQTVNELAMLTVSDTATEPNIHSVTTGYGLLNPPAGASISPSGVITWTPSQGQSPGTNLLTVVVTNNNPYDALNPQLTATNSFTVVVREVNTAPSLAVIGAQNVAELTLLSVTNAASESNIHSTTTGYGLLNPPAGATISSSGVIAWTPSQSQSPSTNIITTVVTNDNPYDAISPRLTATNSFTVIVHEVNSAPTLPVIAPQTVNELALLTVTNSASEPNIHSTTEGYGLVNPPPGASISSSGIVTWTPGQAQSPSTNVLTTVVTNSNPYDSANPHLTATNTFVVVVKEVNLPPVLPAIPTQTIDELALLIVTNTATEPNVHATTAGYVLVNPPAGASIDASGVITWTPSRAQSATTNTITTVVTNSDPYDTINPDLGATNSFLVIVRHTNAPPVLQAITDQTIHYGLPFSAQAVASDPDIPPDTLTFSLDLAPASMTINAASGLISWTPTLAQTGTNTVTVRVTDNGQPPLSATTTFHVLVLGNQPQLSIQPLAGGLVQINIIADVGTSYDLQISTNLLNWNSLLPITLPSSPYPYIDPGSSSAPLRFYRLKVGGP